MAVEVTLPELGEDIEYVTVIYWHFKIADKVNEGDDLVELSTDKMVFNVPAPVSGVLLEILVEEGDTVEVGEALGTIDED
jgi:2-oxoglutarate dehydrogenase E2 component (dihydrolipoamide succinyltransferase)